jgi:hypothetical protein
VQQNLLRKLPSLFIMQSVFVPMISRAKKHILP